MKDQNRMIRGMCWARGRSEQSNPCETALIFLVTQAAPGKEVFQLPSAQVEKAEESDVMEPVREIFKEQVPGVLAPRVKAVCTDSRCVSVQRWPFCLFCCRSVLRELQKNMEPLQM